MSTRLPRIALIATGGTIAGAAEDPTRQLGYRAGALDVRTMLATVPGLDALAVVEAEQLFAIDSAQIEFSHWQLLAARLQAVLEREDVDGAVVLHGTDTLTITGDLLAAEIPSPRVPIVLTGAMRPFEMKRSDAMQNLTESLFAAGGGALAPGVYCVAHGRALKFPGITKDRSRWTFVKA